MRIRLAVPDVAMGPEVLDTALEAVTRTNERLIHEDKVPLASEAIQKHGVKWKPEPPGDEHFDHALTVMKRGWGDCDDLAPYGAASLRVTGEDPGARAVVMRSGPKKWHAVVERSDGSVWDPSADAGMYEYKAPIQPLLRGPAGKANISTRKVGGVWAARCDVPWRGSKCAISSHAAHPDRTRAVRQAVMGACIVGDSSGAVDPAVLHRLAQLDELLRGVPPALVRRACAEYLRAHPEVQGEVGSLFGSIFKAASSLAPAAASLIPGGGMALEAAKGLSKMIPGGGGGGGGGGAPGASSYGPTVGPVSRGGGHHPRSHGHGGGRPGGIWAPNHYGGQNPPVYAPNYQPPIVVVRY